MAEIKVLIPAAKGDTKWRGLQNFWCMSDLPLKVLDLRVNLQGEAFLHSEKKSL